MSMLPWACINLQSVLTLILTSFFPFLAQYTLS